MSVILTDTGPLVALINRNDPNHQACLAATHGLPTGPMLTTWPCFTETMYLVRRAGGYSGQAALWGLLRTGRVALHESSSDETDRMAVLMDKYRDTPMDLADASLIAAAEHLQTRRLFALDSDFHIYRLSDGSTLDIVP
jgi:predicted nucleic acid-binding protein